MKIVKGYRHTGITCNDLKKSLEFYRDYLGLEVIQDFWDNSYYIKYYRISIDDSGKDNDIEQFYFYVKNIIQPIIDEYKKGKTILIHCLAGNQRSAAFVTIFLMYYKKLSLQESINFVLEKKPNVFFFGSNINFMNALLKFEKDINNL